jgi:hypothetical protein
LLNPACGPEGNLSGLLAPNPVLREEEGIDQSFLADVERGKRNVSILNLELIAKGLKLSLSQLFSRL